MTSVGPELRDLINQSCRDLMSAPFPPRRDIDIAWSNPVSAPDFTLFRDVFWPHQDRLTCLLAQVGGALTGRLGAHALKGLLRAAFRLHPAGRALDLSVAALRSGTPSLPIDLAAVCVEPATGAATFLTFGSGRVQHIATQAGGQTSSQVYPGGDADERVKTGRLAQDDCCWLSVGAVPSSDFGPRAWVRNAVDFVRDTPLPGPGMTAALVLRSLRERPGRVFVLSNVAEEIGPTLGEVLRYLDALGVRPDVRAGIELALDELLTNIVLYAFADGRAHEIILDLRLDGAVLAVELRDDGTPFDPVASAPLVDLAAELQDRPIGGLGLHIVRTVFETLEYQRVRGWNVLSLAKADAVGGTPGRACRAALGDVP